MSNLNVGNFIGFRTTGIDGFELANQFDNTPPPPEIVTEAKVQKGQSSRKQLYYLPKTTTGKGAQYEPVERIRRIYSGMHAEMANKLTFLPSYQAWCRLINDPESRGNIGEHPTIA